MTGSSIRFLLDEHMPTSIERLLASRGHDVRRAPAAASDDDILADAELDGSIVVSADKHFKAAVTRNPARDSGRCKRAGLIKVAGEAAGATTRLARYIAIIERLHESCQLDADPREVVYIRSSTALIDF